MKKIVPFIVIGIIVLVGGYLYLNGGTVVVNNGSIEMSKTITSESETFTGDLKAAVRKGTPFKCTFTSSTGMTGVGYIKNRKYYGEISSQGKDGYILMDGKCFWTWDKDKKMGVKSCFENDLWEEDETDQTNAQMDGDYSCTSQNVDDALFELPSDIQFLDADNMGDMEGFTGEEE